MEHDVRELREAMSKDTSALFSDNTRAAYSGAVGDLIAEGRNIVLVEADVMKAAGTLPVRERYPDRVIQVGIAEQNAVGVAAGLADMGFIPIVETFAVLIGRRALDQVWMAVAFSGANVKLAGLYSGFTTAENGATHQSLEDLSVLRAIPEIVILEPVDPRELVQMVRAAVDHVGPVYLRTVRGSLPVIYEELPAFEIGKAVVIAPGDDLAILASGVMVQYALTARNLLAEQGIRARVVNPRTIKPLDDETVLRCAEETGCIVTVEDHGVTGGLGSAVAELLGEQRPTPLRRVGVRDRFGDSGSFAQLIEKYQMDPPAIAEAALSVLSMKT